jgi:asparagine synthase (glutamine-hydrolysing)
MFRYIAFSWTPEDPDQVSRVQALTQDLTTRQSQWHCHFDRDGLRVFCAAARTNGSDVHLLSDQQGIVLGWVYERSQHSSSDHIVQRAAPELPDTAAIVRTEGRRMIDAYWGSYVAFICSPGGRTKLILRGPMSNLPCYNASIRGVDAYFSIAEDCLRLPFTSFSINWSYIRSRVGNSIPQTCETAVNEIQAVEMGECVKVRGAQRSRSFYWHPCSVATLDPIEDMSEAATALRAATRSCVHAWTSGHDVILHRLSGGLDSSIVLGCLRDAPRKPSIACVNYYGRDASDDERSFARAAVALAGCDLVERERSYDVRFDAICAVRPTASPALELSGFDFYHSEVRLARSKGATAIFSGALGDALFQLGPARAAAAEYLGRYGLRSGALEVVWDAAHLSRTSFWNVLRFAIRFGLQWPPSSEWNPNVLRNVMSPGQSPDKRLMDDEAKLELEKEAQRFVHPWFQAAKHVPFGKLWTIAALTLETDYDAPFAREGDPVIIAPLPSQPIVEICLRIPSHLNVHGGRDRAVARQAFAQDLPRAVRTRMTKGRPTAWIREVSMKNAEFLREFLLDGELVRRQLLDRKKLERVLPGVLSKSDLTSFGIIVDHLYTEAWIRSWSELKFKAAA